MPTEYDSRIRLALQQRTSCNGSMPLRWSTRLLLIGSLLVVLALAAWRFQPRPQPAPPLERIPELLWQFGQPERGAVLSSPRLADGRLYFGAIRDFALAPSGIVY